MEAILTTLSHWQTAIVEFVSFDPARLLEPEMMARIALQILLLVGSAFFSGAETALFSLSRLDLQQLRRQRHPKFDTVHTLLEHPRRLIISILCGNELINIAATANMAGILVSLYGDAQAGILNILIMVPLLLLFGEVTPKTIAVGNPIRISTAIVATPMATWVKLVAPFRWAIRLIADRLTTPIVGQDRAAEHILQVDEFRTLVDDVVKGGELTPTERSLIYNLLEAGVTEVVEIMAPRTQTAFIDAATPVADMVTQLRRIRHTRVPVYQGDKDNLIGFLHAEDIMRLVLDDTDLNSLTLADVLKPPVMVPPTKKVDEMFDFFIDNNAHAAAVLNEFGGIEGFVTMRNVLNFIFGQNGLQEPAPALYAELADNVYEVQGDMKLGDFNDLTNFAIDDPRMTTIGGIAFRHLDRLPSVGDQVQVEGVMMTVLDMDGHRIARLRVSKGEIDTVSNNE